jgi:hypothetical protein
MLMAIWLSLRTLTKSLLVNRASLVGVEDFRPSVAAQGLLEGINAEVWLKGVLEIRQERILRLFQSMTATRYMNPCSMGM